MTECPECGEREMWDIKAQCCDKCGWQGDEAER